MANLTTQQMAELLVGIARAQHAVVEALENAGAGFKSKYFRPTLESTSRIRSNHPDSLADFPSRLLLQMLGRNAPDVEQVARSLDALVAALNAAAPAAAQAAQSAPEDRLPDITAPEPEAPQAAPAPNAIPFEAPPPVAAPPPAAPPAPAPDAIPFEPQPKG